MKTIIKSITRLAACIALILSICSFTFQKKAVSLKGTEYSQVREFIYNKICTPFTNADQDKGIKSNMFSRCPSGYQSRLAVHMDSVKVDTDTYGTIKLYRGCAGEYVCDFMVNVKKNTALVKSKEMNEYITVSEWLAKKKEEKKAEPSPIQEKPKEIKG